MSVATQSERMVKGMKKRFFGLVFAVLTVVAIACSFTAFAEDFVFTQHKVVLTYEKETNTVYADVFISKGTAIVGYCSFKYDSDVLELMDVNGNAVTAGNVREFGDNGNIYLTDIVTAHNGIVITDIGKMTPTLVNPEEGYIMFAWFLPASASHISAQEDEVLLANFSFTLKENITYEEFDKDTFWVADNEITDKVDGWYPGIVVMNADQHQFNFDGTVEDGDLFVLDYKLDDLEKSNKPVKKEEPEDEPEVEPEVEPEDEPEVEPETTPEYVPEVEPETTPEVTPEVEPEETPEEEPDDGSTLLNKNASFKADFNLEYTVDETSLKITWKAPENIKKIDNYTAVLCDSNFNVIRDVDIFNSSTSYTFKNLMPDFDYKLYFYATNSGKTYCSDVYDITFGKTEFYSPLIYTVTYDAGKGLLYGLKSEQVVFGDKITKTPSVTAPKGMYFTGWTADGKTSYDTSSPVYANIKLSAMYSDTPEFTQFSYITGYQDGTFNPFGNITRAEAAVLISRISPLYSAETVYNHSFSDCQSGAWYENAVAFCSSNGYITGYLNGTFNPSGKITRAEFATILVRVFEFEGAEEINVFGDIDSHWACPYISRLFCAGIITPDENGMFNPSEALTRKDAVLLINACLGLEPDREAIDNYLSKNGYKFSDVEQYKDYFYPIMAATLKAEEYAD